MIIYVDIDNTICRTEGCNYEEAEPIMERIERVNSWYDAGHRIVYWTARGSGSGIYWMNLCMKQLGEWGCKYHGVKIGKPVYDVFIEDRSAFFEPLSLPEELRVKAKVMPVEDGKIRELSDRDYHKGFIDLLRQLTDVGEVSHYKFLRTFDRIYKNPNHRVYVIEKDGKIVATATLLIEQKFIHECSSVGHIEDVVVDEAMRKRGYGRMLIDHLVSIARNKDCYKIILNTASKNVSFYEKFGFTQKESEMALYL